MMSEKRMLAIVIPFYKKVYFKECLDSLLHQTDFRFNLYIGNDNSPDNISDLINEFTEEATFNVIYKRFENNIGGKSLASQWERCIALSQDEPWLMILGDDDMLGPNVVRDWHINFSDFKDRTNVVRFSTKIINDKNNGELEEFIHPKWESAENSFYRKFKHKTRSSLSEYIFSRKSYEKYGFFEFPLAWNSDDRAWLDFSDGKPIYSINSASVYFRVSNYNISGKTTDLRIKNSSAILFYRYMVNSKLLNYDYARKIALLRRYEDEMSRYGKIKLSGWFELLFYYIKNFSSYEFKKFMKRFIKSYIFFEKTS